MLAVVKLVLLLLASTALLPSRTGQAGEPSSSVHPACTTCAGRGRARLPCELCNGDGTAPCVECANGADEEADRRLIAILREIDPERAKLREMSADQRAEFRDIGNRSGISKYADRRPGKLPCPEACKAGVSFLNAGHACKVCAAKGSLQCKACKGKGEARCEACGGRRKLDVTCHECAGGGVAPDPLKRTAEAATCPWCDDRRVVDCRVCEEGALHKLCGTCRGGGTTACTDCAGTKMTGCRKCSGTGDLSSYLAAKNSNDCDHCDKSGVVDCVKCRLGRVECAECKGKGHYKGRCPACLGTRKSLCAGCTLDSDLAWTITGERLALGGAGPAALAHFDVAIARIERRHAQRLESFTGSKKERDAFANQLAKQAAETKKQRAEIAKRVGL